MLIILFAALDSFAVGVLPDPGECLMEGIASWYSESSPGINETTANMERFDHDKLTCAAWNIPFNTMLEVTNLSNGKSVLVRVNDRGPAERYCTEGRVIDLTIGAFARIEDPQKGLAPVEVRIAE
ncbi:MAG: septal ring lytic transglycosylase RlpA family protein [Candidatus Omnitrophica bacterium]|nr:septal ring lytic transglycosylase RlpA family protein [Candidatus Omnitrophota bacterium]